MRISDWSSDVCASDLPHRSLLVRLLLGRVQGSRGLWRAGARPDLPADRAAGAARGREGLAMATEARAAAEKAFDLLPVLKEAGVAALLDRKRVVSGKSVSVRGDTGGRRSIKKK